MVFSRPLVLPLPWSLWIMLICTFINVCNWLCLVFDFWHLCRTMYLGYSMPFFSIVAGIYATLYIQLKFWRHLSCKFTNTIYFSSLPLADANLSYTYLLKALPWIHSCLLLYSVSIWILHEEKYNRKIILKMVCFYWPRYIYF